MSKKRIGIKCLTVSKASVQFQIVEQTFRDYSSFDAYNGIRISGCACPEINVRTFFIRGDSPQHDLDILEVSSIRFLNIMEAVHEYNYVHKN